MSRNAVTPRHTPGNAFDADINRDMLLEQFRRNAQLDVFGYEIGRMIGNAHYSARCRFTYLAIGQVIDHHCCILP
jgi:hypothetical protein